MSSISRIVDVDIARGGIAVQRAGFGIPLIVSDSTVLTGRFQLFSSLQEVSDAGFSTDSVEFVTASLMLQQTPQIDQFAIGRIDIEDENITESLQAIIDSPQGNTWYALILLDKTESVVLEAAAFIETQRKFFMTSSSDAGIINNSVTDDLASQLKDLSFSRTSVFYHSSADRVFAEAAYLGDTLALDAGALTFKHRQLTGIAADNLTGGQIATLQSKNANFFVTVGGIPITCDGTVAVGEFIDIIRDTDATQADIEESVFEVIANADRIPFTQGGIAIVENELRGALARAEAAGILASPDGILPAFTINAPVATAISKADRAARRLTGLTFTGTYAGAIHFTDINGTLSV